MKLEDINKDRILELIGLESRTDASARALGVLGLVGLGLLAGATIGLLFAPTPGDELRRELSRRLGLDKGPLANGEALDELIT